MNGIISSNSKECWAERKKKNIYGTLANWEERLGIMVVLTEAVVG